MSHRAIWAHPSQNPEGYKSLCEFAALRIWGEVREFPTGTAMAVVGDDKVKAVVIYANYDPHSGVVEINLAGDGARWMTRPILKEMFSYPFDQLKCQAVIARISPENKALRRIVKAYGFSSHVIPRLRGRDEAEVIAVLAEEDWRTNGFHKETT